MKGYIFTLWFFSASSDNNYVKFNTLMIWFTLILVNMPHLVHLVLTSVEVLYLQENIAPIFGDLTFYFHINWILCPFYLPVYITMRLRMNTCIYIEINGIFLITSSSLQFLQIQMIKLIITIFCYIDQVLKYKSMKVYLHNQSMDHIHLKNSNYKGVYIYFQLKYFSAQWLRRQSLALAINHYFLWVARRGE